MKGVRKRLIEIAFAVVFVVFMVVFGFLGSEKASAASVGDIMKKWVFTDYLECLPYISGEIKDEGGKDKTITIDWSDSEKKHLPSEGFGGNTNEDITCDQLFKGTGGLKSNGVLGYAGLSVNQSWKNDEQAKDYLTKLGYKQNELTEGNYLFQIKALNEYKQWISSDYGSTSPESFPESEVVSPIVDVSFDNDKVSDVKINNSTFAKYDITVEYNRNNQTLTIGVIGGLGCVIKSVLKEIRIDLSNVNKETIKGTIEEELKNGRINVECNKGEITYANSYIFADTNLVYEIDGEGNYTFEKTESHYKEVISELSGMNVSNGDLRLKDYELYALYNYYLESVIPNDGQPNRKVCNPEDKTNLIGPVKLKSPDGGSCDYYINWNGQWETLKNKEFWTQYDSLSIGSITLEDIIGWLNDHTDSISDEDAVLQIDSSQNDNKGDCYKAGLEGLSWLVCPALNNMVSVADGMDRAIDAQLSVDSSWYDSQGATREAWGYFRDIANVLMIIVLLVVIVSQLTGFGIDNYGIKKILPRLIAVAVMINLSFFVCQIAIDISNILGDGLSSFLKSIGLTINSDIGGEGIIAGLANAILALAAGAGAASSTIITLYFLKEAGPFFVITLVIVVVLVLVSVIMFFATLGARIIIIIMMTVLSPLAFACYVLPNTQKIFKKWWDIFKAALVVYPICGALYGISWIVRAVVFKPENGIHFFMAIVAMLAPFLPFLVLPELLKDTLNALGHIGNVFSRIGTGVRSGISKGMDAMQRTEGFKEASAYSSDKLMDKWDKRIAKKYGNSTDPRKRSRASLANQRIASREVKQFKEYDESYQILGGNAMEEKFNEVLNSYSGKDDDAKMAAAVRNMTRLGKQQEMMEKLYESNKTFGNRTMAEFISSGAYALTAYGKKGFDNNGQAKTFNDFIDSKGEGGTFENYQNDNNTRGMEKDTMAFLNSVVSKQGENAKVYLSTENALDVVVGASDGKVKNVGNTYLEKQIGRYGLEASEMSDFRTSSLTSIDDSTALALENGVNEYNKNHPDSKIDIKKVFASQIAGAKQNIQVLSEISPETKRVFGLDGGEKIESRPYEGNTGLGEIEGT